MKKNKYFKHVKTDLILLESIIKTNPKFKNHIDTNKLFYIRVMPDLYACLIHTIISANFSSDLTDAAWNRLMDITKQKLTPDKLIKIPKETLLAMGLTNQKTQLIRKISFDLDTKKLNLKKLVKKTDKEIMEVLYQYKGIGPWVVKTYLIFGCMRPNVLMIEDKTVIKALEYCFERNLTKEELYNTYVTYSPNCTLLSMILWKIASDLKVKKEEKNEATNYN